MSEESLVSAELTASRTYCVCGEVMEHTEWEGMLGWLCPACGNFIPDPI